MSIASHGERIGGLIGGRSSRERSRIVEEFVPSSAWSEDENFHYLLVDLPGFAKEQVKLVVDDEGNITASGERILNNGKGIFFHQTFQPMPHSDINKISGNFEGGMLYVILPKQETEEETEEFYDDDDHDDNDENDQNGIVERNTPEIVPSYEDHDHEENNVASELDMPRKQQWGQNSEAMEMVMKVMRNNKGILVTAVLAFSLGVYIARKFDSAHQE